MGPKFEIHLEEWNHALHIDGRGHQSDVNWLYDLLAKHNIMPISYVLKDWADENSDTNCHLVNSMYTVKSHGVHHYYDEKADRSPYFNQEGIPGFCGGFFFRLLPSWLIRMEIRRTGMFYIHPHDLDVNHPKLKNPLMNWKRHVGLKGAKKKLEALIESIDNWS